MVGGLDLVVARVGAALSRGHALFSPAPVDGSGVLAGSSVVLGSAAGRVGDGVQLMDAHGGFGRSYGDAGGRLAGRFAAAGGLDRVLGGIAGDAAGADGRGRGQSGEVVSAAGDDVARVGPYANTPAGQQALLQTLRDRVDEQRRVIAAYRQRDARLAAMVRQLSYGRGGGGGGLGSMLGGMPGGGGGGRGSGSGAGLGNLPVSQLVGLVRPDRSPNSGLPGDMGVANDPDSGLGAPAARAALSRRGSPYVWGAKGPNQFDCSGLTKWAWGQVGVTLGNDTYSQINEGVPVPQGQVRAGDLIFPLDAFGEGGRSGPGHVQLAISPTQVVHAPQPGDAVKVAGMPSRYIARRPR
ncbi:NLP/P60 protein [Mycobacterium lentiflavum]|uniref:NLP/P60 protein n=1 Tax=Mycobacterium lentiflavum TaxID=141349 RepID=A0A0E4H1X4_MYCLN|nr:C40 family peptidase [Mycobacterium lentiflavum]CQD24152.1 NLP/P60 protein [Mycobacterium lentiflavum]